jgi:hypothetical protein
VNTEVTITPTDNKKPNKTDAGDGSYGIFCVIDGCQSAVA